MEEISRLKIEEAEKMKKAKEEEMQQSVTPASATFSESMSPVELAEWLLKELGSEFKDDIDKLRSKPTRSMPVVDLLSNIILLYAGNKINGSVFLQLPCEKEALKEFGLSFGFKALLPSKVKEV